MIGIKIITKAGLAASISSGPMVWPKIVGCVIFSPWSTQVEKVWSNSAQNIGTSANTNRIGLTERAAETSASLCWRRAPSQNKSGSSALRAKLKATVNRYQSPMQPREVQLINLTDADI